jgi:hypothetical protein
VSQFEYISVAASLVYSLLLAKLVGAIPAAIRGEQRYWIHTLWVVNLALGCMVSWWGLWSFREVVWGPGRFLALFAFPSIIYLRAIVLLTEEPREVRSWLDHYYRSRRAFFLLGVVGGANQAISPRFIMGEPQPTLVAVGAAAFAVISGFAAFSPSPTLHAAVAVLSLIVLAAFPFVVVQ